MLPILIVSLTGLTGWTSGTNPYRSGGFSTSEYFPLDGDRSGRASRDDEAVDLSSLSAVPAAASKGSHGAPAAAGAPNFKVFFDLNKTIQNKSLREFYNSLYFRGDRLAFAIKNADARKAVSFECLHGRYTLGELTTERHEIEYIELRENNVYGLTMLGSLVEKQVAQRQQQKYSAIPPFQVNYEIFCGKDLLAKRRILLELK